MAHYQDIVLDYLESYQPRKYRELRRGRGLREYMDVLVEQLYAETDRVLRVLQDKFPEQAEDYLRIYAEELAISAVLPVPQQTTGDQDEGEKPSSYIKALTQLGRLAQPAQSNGWEAQQ